MASARKPPPRRKSCAECIKSKRRCDQGFPTCTRCRRLKLDCSYGASTQNAGHNESLVPPSSDTPGISIDQVSSPLALQDGSLVTSIDPSLVNSNDFGACHLLPDLDGSLSIDLDGPDMPTPAVPDNPIIRHAIEEFLLGDVSAIIESRFRYGLEQMRSGPREMALKVQTPWSHPLLYQAEMPQIMKDAYAACALYTTKTETNSGFVLRHIITNLEGMLSSPASIAPLELLARAQALLLYCIILIYDGGIRERARAEAALDHLQSFAIALDPFVGIIDPAPQTLCYYPTAHSTSVWRTWIFRESLRRTFLACFFFFSMCHAMKESVGYCRNHTAFSSIWTASAHLWGARSVMDFITAWNEKKHYVVHGLDFTEIIANARADDVDEFGRMLLVAYMGADDARGWFHTRGGAL